MVVYIVMVRAYNYLNVQRISFVRERTLGRVGLHGVRVVFLVETEYGRPIETVQARPLTDRVLHPAMDQVSTR